MLDTVEKLWIKHSLDDRIRHLREIGADNDYSAVVLAEDHLRKMGVFEREYAIQHLTEYAPEVMQVIRDRFPARAK